MNIVEIPERLAKKKTNAKEIEVIEGEGDDVQ